MKKNFKLINLNLKLFDGAGAGASGGDGTGEGTATMGEETNTSSVAEKNNRANDLSKVVYGKQEDTPQTDIDTHVADGNETTVTEKTIDERKAEFEKLIQGDYKDIYTEKFQETFNKRFKETKILESQVEKVSPLVDMLSARYGVDAQDLDSLLQAIEEDESFYEEEALEKGLTVEQLKEMKKMERENAQLRKVFEQSKAQEEANKIYSQWLEQGETLKEVYPNFELNNEVQNEDFVKLLQNGIDVKTAYEVIHKDEIIGGAMQYTAQQVQQKVVNNIKARGNRPTENGISSQSAAVTKTDVNSLSKKDREEIDRRVQRGEKIVF